MLHPLGARSAAHGVAVGDQRRFETGGAPYRSDADLSGLSLGLGVSFSALRRVPAILKGRAR